LSNSALRILAFAAAVLFATQVHAQIIAGAVYDPVRDQLVADLVYQGTNPNHPFSLAWGECGGGEPPYEVEARVIDKQGDDIADQEFRVRRRFSLQDLKCRPALLTLRMGRHVFSPVFIPAPR
jgi:hypothetical protein